MKFIINADDFGMTTEINAAIYSALSNNWISSATVMSGSAYIEQAAEICADMKHSSFGAHLALDGPFNVGKENNKIVSSSEFRQDNIKRFKQCNLNLVSDIDDEFSRQIEKLLDLDIPISHVDTHHHLHLYLPVLQGLIRAAKKHGIYKVRSLVLPVNQSAVKRAYRWLHDRYARSMGMSMPDCYCKFQELEYLPRRYLSDESVVEIMCHPGLDGYDDESFFNEDFYKQLNKSNIINYNQL